MRLSLKQLRYICAVSEHLHFGHAAEACFVTQSTLSAGIQDLEGSLEVKIFERTNKRVFVTEKGKDIVERAKRVLQEVSDLVDAASQNHEPLSGKLIIGAIPTVSPFLLPRLLPKLRKQYPQLKMFLREDQTAALLEDLDNGRIDVALIALPFPVDKLVVTPLFDEAFSLACLPSHPTNQLKQLKTHHLQDESLLLLEEGHCLRQHALDACKLQAASYGVPYQGTSLTTLIQMVANGIGITLVPEMAITSGLLKKTGVVAHGFADKSVKRSIGLVWRQNSSKHQDLKLLADFIKANH
ncbi:MAG: LysR family transcriptional regulator [Moraxellaceae bacterium]|nr:MAG: LysR family transcriptional regulator [Moraxellaceae bacterium]